MMIAALLFAANTVVAWEPPPPACPTPSPVNVFVAHVGLYGSCSNFAPEPCPAGVPISFLVGTFGYSFGCSVHAFAWDFGDGMTSNQMNPVHTFTPGTYDVKLRITNPYGAWVFIDHVVVDAGSGDLPPDFTYSTDGNVVHFSIENPGLQVAQWKFDFGDGTTATISGANPQEIVHSYAKSGRYVVILMAGTDFVRARQISVTFPSRSRGARH